MGRFHEDWDLIWTLYAHQTIEGSITIDGFSGDRRAAHLRWFIVSDRLRGRGAGHFLMKKAMDFCKARSYVTVYLWTFEGLSPARHLYEKLGFRLVEEHSGAQWGRVVKEQRFEAALREQLKQ
jgi:GNAT superfamily N-acetyltransferase